MQQDDPRNLPDDGEGQNRASLATLRELAHDMNGALNNLALNLELLERAMRGEGNPAPECERYFANLRRALEQLTQIAGSRLLPLASSPPESPET